MMKIVYSMTMFCSTNSPLQGHASALRTAMIFCFSFFAITTGFSQYVGLESEVHAESEYGTTYRVYAVFESSFDEVQAIYSIGTSETGSVSLELQVRPAQFPWSWVSPQASFKTLLLARIWVRQSLVH